MTQIQTQTQTRPASQDPLPSTPKISALPRPRPPRSRTRGSLRPRWLAVGDAAAPNRKGPGSRGVPIVPPTATPWAASLPTSTLGPTLPTQSAPRRPRRPTPVYRALPPGRRPSHGQKRRGPGAHVCTRTHAVALQAQATGPHPPAPPPLPETDTPLEGRPEKTGRERLFTDSKKKV